MFQNVVPGIGIAVGLAVIGVLWKICEVRRERYLQIWPWLAGGIFAAILLGVAWSMSSEVAMRWSVEWLLLGWAAIQYVANLPRIQNFVGIDSENRSQTGQSE
jgi:hypothetical protein